MIKILILFLLSTSSLFANNLSLSAGTSVNYLNISDKNYSYVNSNDQLKLSGLNLGFNYKTNTPVVVSIFTNRVLNISSSREVRNRNNNKIFELASKADVDTFSVGYKYNRIIPAIFLSNVNLDKKLTYQNKIIGKEHLSSFVYGFTLNYLYDKNISIYASILAPNKEFGIETGVIVGFNYNFNLI